MYFTNLRPTIARASNFNRPAVNVLDGEEAYTLQLALPGWRKEDVELEVDGELLIIRGELPETEDAPSFRRREFGLQKFEKSFHLPDSVEVDAIAATLEQGILSVSLPKEAEAQPVRKAIAIG